MSAKWNKRAARRQEAEARAQLFKRRAWFDDPAAETGDKSGDKSGDGKDKGGDDAPPEWVRDPAKAYAEIQKLRQEAAAHRTGKSEIEKKLGDIEAARKAAEDAALAEQSRWKELAEKREKELAEARAAVAAQEALALRRRIAIAAGLPEEFAERLRGTTEAELQADAETLKPLLAAQGDGRGKGKPNTTPNPQGEPAAESDAARRERLRGGGNAGMFGGGGVRYYGNEDLQRPPGQG